MRRTILLSAVLSLALPAASWGQMSEGARLAGAWRLLSITEQAEGESESRNLMGPAPRGRVIFAGNRMTYFATGGERPRGGEDPAAIAQFR